jgi:periplasmic divalent cation tolerance protein
MLSCADHNEAHSIINTLLNKKLIICAKKTEVATKYYWKGKIEQAHETLLIMDSAEHLFSRIEEELKKLHSYDTFNLVMIPITKTSSGIADWMNEGLAK